MTISKSNVSLSFILLLNLFVLVIGINGIGHLSMFLANKIFPSVNFLDRDNAFLLITIHHFIQALIGLSIIGLILLITDHSLSDFGFQLKGFKSSLRPMILFGVAFCCVQLIGTFLYVYGFHYPLQFSYALTPYNFIGQFLFQIFVSGTSEEILFRSLVLFIIAASTKKYAGNAKAIYISTIVISSIVFMIGHLGISFNPFKIVYVNWLQQLTCLSVSIFYCWLLLKYKCIYSCMITHNVLNGFVVLITLLFVLIGK